MADVSVRFWLDGRWWYAYRPAFAPVVGTYPEAEVDEETGEREPQPITLKCERCGDEHRHVCTTGNVRSRVATFGRLHVHVDPFGRAQLKRTAPGENKPLGKKDTDT